jgi:WD40 repeat protein
VQFTADGRLASVGRDSAIRVWSVDGKAQSASQPADGLLTKAAVSFDGKLAIAGDYQGRIVIWDGENATTLTAHSERAPSISAPTR